MRLYLHCEPHAMHPIVTTEGDKPLNRLQYHITVYQCLAACGWCKEKGQKKLGFCQLWQPDPMGRPYGQTQQPDPVGRPSMSWHEMGDTDGLNGLTESPSQQYTVVENPHNTQGQF